MWDTKVIFTDDCVGCEFSLVSPDGDEGYPGEVHVCTVSRS